MTRYLQRNASDKTRAPKIQIMPDNKKAPMSPRGRISRGLKKAPGSPRSSGSPRSLSRKGSKGSLFGPSSPKSGSPKHSRSSSRSGPKLGFEPGTVFYIFSQAADLLRASADNKTVDGKGRWSADSMWFLEKKGDQYDFRNVATGGYLRVNMNGTVDACGTQKQGVFNLVKKGRHLSFQSKSYKDKFLCVDAKGAASTGKRTNLFSAAAENPGLFTIKPIFDFCKAVRARDPASHGPKFDFKEDGKCVHFLSFTGASLSADERGASASGAYAHGATWKVHKVEGEENVVRLQQMKSLKYLRITGKSGALDNNGTKGPETRFKIHGLGSALVRIEAIKAKGKFLTVGDKSVKLTGKSGEETFFHPVLATKQF
ncbi:hypothetical protein AAMO2058_000889900 [Amorphochlora amoebiformis]